MNKKFIKKNIFLIIFMSMALVAVIALLIMVFFQHESMKKYDTKKKDLLKKVHKMFDQRYVPVMVNVTRIKKDVVGYKRESKKVESKFGQPYIWALESFVDIVDIPLDEFKTKFSEFWEEESSGDTKTRDQIYRIYKVRQFNVDFPKHKSDWETAMLAFMRKAQNVTLEEINDSNVDGIFLAVMGRGRRFSDSPSRCLTFMRRMRYEMIDYLTSKKVEYKTKENFSFNDEQLPLAGDIEQIAAAWEIVSDLIKRIADANVNPKEDRLELVEFSKRGLDGATEGDYTLYRFNFTISGNLATIRRVVKKLYEAYKENRVYAIRNIKITRIVDNVDEILEASEKIKEEVDYDSATEGERRERGDIARGATGLFSRPSEKAKPRFGSARGDRRSLSNTIKDDKKKPLNTVAEKKKILGPKDPGYARVIIGSNNICSAELEVDYIIFNNSQNN